MTHSFVETRRTTAKALDTIVLGGLTAGVLDLIENQVVYSFKGIDPIQALQYIASGALGNDAFKGGLSTAALGAALHFFVAFVVAAVYYAASRNFDGFYKNPGIWGPVFGVSVYFLMSFVVLTLSAAPTSPLSFPIFLNGVLGHAVCVGLPIAWFAHRSARIQHTA
jgi:hypothetical protein